MIDATSKTSSGLNSSALPIDSQKGSKTESDRNREKDFETQKSFQRMPTEPVTGAMDRNPQNMTRHDEGTNHHVDRNSSSNQRGASLINTLSPVTLMRTYPKASIATAFGLGILASRGRKSMLGSTVLLSVVTLGMEYLNNKLARGDFWQPRLNDFERNNANSNPMHPEGTAHESTTNRNTSNFGSDSAFAPH